MSEKHVPNQEKHALTAGSNERHKRQQEILDEAKNEASKAEHEHSNKIEQIRDLVNEQAAETTAHPSREITAQDEPAGANTYWHSREYRELAFKQLMNRVRKHMSKPEQAASKFMHKPAIEKASEIGEKTVARTSGVLFGSIFSFIASLGTYYFSRRNGYDMTYSIFIVSFLGGFFAGLLIELFYKATRSLLSRS